MQDKYTILKGSYKRTLTGTYESGEGESGGQEDRVTRKIWRKNCISKSRSRSSQAKTPKTNPLDDKLKDLEPKTSRSLDKGKL